MVIHQRAAFSDFCLRLLSSCVIRAEGSVHCSKAAPPQSLRGRKLPLIYFLLWDSLQPVWAFPERHKNQAAVISPAAESLKIDEVVWRDWKLVVWWKRSWLTQFLPQGSLNFYLLSTHTKQADLWQAYTVEAYITLTAVNIACRKGFRFLPSGEQLQRALIMKISQPNLFYILMSVDT